MATLTAPLAPVWPSIETTDERAARVDLRRQIARLELRLAAFPVEGAGPARRPNGGRVLGLRGLERVRDDLVERLHAAGVAEERRADEIVRHREHLEAMVADPGRHRWERIFRRDLGLPGCGAYHVRPRLGLVGMLAGWWEVKLSSGCP
jgi:hypothetical protein